MIFGGKLLWESLGSRWARLVCICVSQITAALKGQRLPHIQGNTFTSANAATEQKKVRAVQIWTA